MAVLPVVRYMLLCDDWHADPANHRRITVVGLICNIRSITDPPYPLFYREFCVLLLLTEGYGQGVGRVVCVDDETGRPLFESRPRIITFRPDPLEILGVPFRLRDCSFPKAGLYTVQFWYDGELVEERPLRMR